MSQKIFFLISSLVLLSLSACAGTKKQYSCAWTPDMIRPHDATFCVDFGVRRDRAGSSLPVLEDPETKKIMQANGQEFFLDSSKTSAIKKKAFPSGQKRKCSHIWISAKIEVKSDTGEYWSPQWGSEDRIIAKRTFPFYKVLIQELNEVKCVKK